LFFFFFYDYCQNSHVFNKIDDYEEYYKGSVGLFFSEKRTLLLKSGEIKLYVKTLCKNMF